MLMFDCRGRKERGGNADTCTYTRIRNTFNRLRDMNQRSTELAGFAIPSFSKNIKVIRILRLIIS